MTAQTLQVHAYHWKALDHYTENEHEEIQCWAFGPDNKPCLLRFQTFPVFCQVELPKLRGEEWSIGKTDQVFNWLKFVMKDNAPITYKSLESQTIYYYQGHIKKSFMTIMFKNQNSLSHCTNLLAKPRKFGELGFLELKVHENYISSVRKMLTASHLKYCQWFSFKGEIPEERVSKLDNEYVVDYRTIKPLNDDEVPSVTAPYVLSFDIECYSHNKRIFTNEKHPRHCVFMIQMSFKRLGDNSTRKRFVIFKGDERHISTDRATVFGLPSEKDIIDKFAQLIDEMDPDLIIGYNIMTYDYPYLNHRLKRHLYEWYECGRLVGVKPVSRGKKWKSGVGYMNNEYLDMDGRLSIDLLPIIRRDYKLRLYSLNYVGKYFIGRGKHDVSAEYMFKACEMSWSATDPSHPNWDSACEMISKTAEYGIEDCELVMDIFEKINGWIGLTEMSSIVGVNIIDLFISGQQMRCESLLYNKAVERNIVLDKRPMPKCDYSGGFVFEPEQGIDDHVIGVDFKSLYPSIIAAYNICFSTLMDPECHFQISKGNLHVFDFEQEEGNDSSDDDSDDEEVQVKRKKKAKKTKIVKHYYEFVDKSTHEGILPSLVTELVRQRDMVRKKQKTIEGTIMWKVLQQRQLALKVTANSFYGFLGVQEGGRLPLIEGAMCITAKGRELILKCNKYAEEKYNATVVYNDTDSSFFKIPSITNGAEADRMGKQIAREMTDMFPPPLKMEFEKAMRVLRFKKKKYSYVEPDSKGRYLVFDEGDIESRGILTARRDNCSWVRNTYMNVLIAVMRRCPMAIIMRIVVNAIESMVGGIITAEDLAIVKGLGANYSNESYFMNVFSEELKAAGQPVKAGERLEYVVVDTGVKDDLLGKKMRLLENYIDDSDALDIDTMYYLSNQLMNPVDQIVAIAYKKELDSLKEIGFQPGGNFKFVSVLRPVKLIYMALKFNVPMGEIKQWFMDTFPLGEAVLIIWEE
jgi:DNA polymerase delta subunit 1